jgi:phosphoribosylamine-glycine ligase
MLLVSATGYGLGIAPHLSSEGHQVNTFVNKVLSIPHITNAIGDMIPDIAIFDSPDQYVPAEWVRTRGVRVLGASQWSNLLDSNEDYLKKTIQAIGYKPHVNEVGTGAEVVAWFNGQRFISKSIVFNYEHFMPGDTGVKLVSSGYVAKFDVDKSKLVDDILGPLEKYLRKAGHRGVFVVSVVVTDDGKVLVKGLSANMNKPYTNALYENTRRSKSDIVLDMFNESSNPSAPVDAYVVGVLLSVYPYPYTTPENPLEILGINPFNLKHLWLMDAEKKEDKWFSGSLSGCVGYVTARGSSVQEACRRAYRTISNLKIDVLQYRNDIGKDTNEKIFKLRKLNLL